MKEPSPLELAIASSVTVLLAAVAADFTFVSVLSMRPPVDFVTLLVSRVQEALVEGIAVGLLAHRARLHTGRRLLIEALPAGLLVTVVATATNVTMFGTGMRASMPLETTLTAERFFQLMLVRLGDPTTIAGIFASAFSYWLCVRGRASLSVGLRLALPAAGVHLIGWLLVLLPIVAPQFVDAIVGFTIAYVTVVTVGLPIALRLARAVLTRLGIEEAE